MRNAIITILAALCVLPVLAQSQKSGTRTMIGRVVESVNGQTKGVPKVTVKISDDFDFDITDENGNFKLDFPPDRDFVMVVVENAPNKMISPPRGLVNIPPERDLRIVLCGEQNQRLMQQANALNGRVKKLEKEKHLTQLQLLEMHRQLLDTTLYYENMIARMEQQSKETQATLDAEIRARDAEIESLKDSLFVLTQRISDLLEERFLKQKEYFDRISADLLEYADRVKDLRNRLTPDRVPNYFKNEGAKAELNRTTAAYNEMRETIIRTHKGNVVAVEQYWENSDAAKELKNTYDYLLKNVHEAHVLPMHQGVVGPIQNYTGEQTGRMSAQKDSKKAAEEKIPGLSAAILELDKKIQNAINALSKNI